MCNPVAARLEALAWAAEQPEPVIVQLDGASDGAAASLDTTSTTWPKEEIHMEEEAICELCGEDDGFC